MIKYLLLTALPMLSLFSCKEQPQQQSGIPVPALHITCENEKLLLEHPLNNTAYSFDSIPSTRLYWQQLRRDQAAAGENKLYPYISVSPDMPSDYEKINISLIGGEKLCNDDRLKFGFYADRADSSLIERFYTKVFNEDKTIKSEAKAELFVSFFRDSITGIEAPLKIIAAAYLSSQRKNAQQLFGRELCSLDSIQLDSIRRKVPFRIRLGRNS